DEQSIYSWAGADPRVFRQYANDFDVTRRIVLRENRRCSREILALARRLIEHNPTLFDEPKLLEAERESAFCVAAHGFADDAAEREWLVADVRRDHAEHGIPWGEVAVLYRTHSIGEVLEENHDELTDPAAQPEIERLAARLADARQSGRTIWLERRRGAEIPLAGLLRAAGFRHVSTDAVAPPDPEPILVDDAPTLGLP